MLGFFALSNKKSDNPNFFIAWDDDDWRAYGYPIFFLLDNLGLMLLFALCVLPFIADFFFTD